MIVVLFLLFSPYLLWLLWALLRYPLPLSYNVRSLLQRWPATLSTLGAVAIVVTIFVVVLSMSQGVSQAYVQSGRENHVVVMRQNARVEMMSVVTRDQARLLSTHPLIERDEVGPLVTFDTIVSRQFPLEDGSGTITVAVRGTTPAGIRMREQVRIVQGRWFRPGLSEVVLPVKMVGRYAGVKVGGHLEMGGRTWSVVGLFDGGGSVYDSEAWTDAEDLMQAYHRPSAYSSVTARLRNPSAVGAFIRDAGEDVRLKLEAKPEPAYFAEQGDAGKPMQILGNIITVILTVGAVFAAMNTMYAAVAGRTAEIGTLRALGFRRREILASFQWEAILLTAAGGLLGALLSLAFNGIRSGAVNMNTWSDVSYAFTVTPALMVQGAGFGILMGILGGLLPAWRASRIPVTEAMRG